MIWIDDFKYLDALYLKAQFRPWENGITAETLGLSLVNVDNAVQEHLLSHIDERFSSKVRMFLSNMPSATQEHIRLAQETVIRSYLWELIYWKYPEAYEKFSQCQQFAFERFFPKDLISGSTVLDIGCGSGKLTSYLTGFAKQIFAVDPAVPLLEICKRRLAMHNSVNVLRGSFANIPLENESVDLVTSSMAFQCSEERGGKIGLRSMRRVVRRGGEIRMIVGSSTTQDFLLNEGFTEKFYAFPLSWDNDDIDQMDTKAIVAKMLRAIATNESQSSREMLFDSAGWRWQRTISGLISVLNGNGFYATFRNGNIKRPFGVPVFIWVKKS